MLGFEPWISSVGSGRSANCATTTAKTYNKFSPGACCSTMVEHMFHDPKAVGLNPAERFYYFSFSLSEVF